MGSDRELPDAVVSTVLLVDNFRHDHAFKEWCSVTVAVAMYSSG